MSEQNAVTLKAEELIAEIIRRKLPHLEGLVVEGSDQTTDLPHPIYVSVMHPDDAGSAPAGVGTAAMNTEVDVIRMAYYNATTHLERKKAVAELQSIFTNRPEPWMSHSIIPGVYLAGWWVESFGNGDVDDYVGDGLRLGLALVIDQGPGQ